MSQEYTKCIICGKDIDVCWRHNDKNKKKVMGSGCKCQVEITEDNIIFYCGGKQVTLTKKNDQLQIFDNQFNTFNLDFNAFKFNPDDAIDILKEYNIDETCVFKKSNEEEEEIVTFDKVAVAYKSIVYDNKYFKLKEDNDTLYLNHDCINLNTHNLLLFGPDVNVDELDHVHFGIYHNDYSQSIFKKVNDNMVLKSNTLKKSIIETQPSSLKCPYLYYKPSGSEEETKYVLLEFDGVKSYYEVDKLDLKEDKLLYYDDSILISYITFEDLIKEDNYLELIWGQTPKSDMYIDENTFKCLTLCYDTRNDQMSETYLKTEINKMLGNNLYNFIKRRHLGYDTIYPKQIPDSYYDPLNYPDVEILKPLFIKLEINPKIIYKYNTSNKVPFYYLLRDRGASEIPFKYSVEDVVKCGTIPEIITQITKEDTSFYNYDKYTFKTSTFTFNDVTDLKHNIKTPEFEVYITIVYINKGSSIYYIIHNINRNVTRADGTTEPDGIPTVPEDPTVPESICYSTYIYDIDKQLRFNIPFVYDEPKDDQKNIDENLPMDISKIDGAENKIEELKLNNIIKTTPDILMWCVPGLTCSYAHSYSSVAEVASVYTNRSEEKTIREEDIPIEIENINCSIELDKNFNLKRINDFSLKITENNTTTDITINDIRYSIYGETSVTSNIDGETNKMTLTFFIFKDNVFSYSVVFIYDNVELRGDNKMYINDEIITTYRNKKAPWNSCEIKNESTGETKTLNSNNDEFNTKFKASIAIPPNITITTCFPLKDFNTNFNDSFTKKCDRLIKIGINTIYGGTKDLNNNDVRYYPIQLKIGEEISYYLCILFANNDVVYYAKLKAKNYIESDGENQWLFTVCDGYLISDNITLKRCSEHHGQNDLISINVSLSGLFKSDMSEIIDSNINPCKLTITKKDNAGSENYTITTSNYNATSKTIKITGTYSDTEFEMTIELDANGEIVNINLTDNTIFIIENYESNIKLQKPIEIKYKVYTLATNNEEIKYASIESVTINGSSENIETESAFNNPKLTITKCEYTDNFNFSLSFDIIYNSVSTKYDCTNLTEKIEFKTSGSNQIDPNEYPINITCGPVSETIEHEVEVNISGYLYTKNDDLKPISFLDEGSGIKINNTHASIVPQVSDNGTKINFTFNDQTIGEVAYCVVVTFDMDLWEITNIELQYANGDKIDDWKERIAITATSAIKDYRELIFDIQCSDLDPNNLSSTENITMAMKYGKDKNKITDITFTNKYLEKSDEFTYKLSCNCSGNKFKDSSVFECKIIETKDSIKLEVDKDKTTLTLLDNNDVIHDESIKVKGDIIILSRYTLTLDIDIPIDEKYVLDIDSILPPCINYDESKDITKNRNEFVDIKTNENIQYQLDFSFEFYIKIDEKDYTVYYNVSYNYLTGILSQEKNVIKNNANETVTDMVIRIYPNIKIKLQNIFTTNELKFANSSDKQNIYYIEYKNINDTFKFEKNNTKNYKFILNTIDQSGDTIELKDNLLTDYFIAYNTIK